MSAPAHAASPPGRLWQWLSTRTLWAAVTVLGVAMSLGFSYHAATVPGVYWSSVKVNFLAPLSTENQNPYAASSSSLAITAGLVGKLVNATTPKAPFNSEMVPLAGQGIRDGQEITLSNAGGQWVAIYSNPWLDVQADGPRSDVVVQRMSAMIDSINAALAGLQKDVAARDRITTRVDPSQLPVYYQKGSRARAAIASLALGLIVTACIVTIGRRRVRAHLRRRREAMDGRPPARDRALVTSAGGR